MTQQLDPKQVRGLKDELDTLDSMAKIKSIGANLTLDENGELSATGGGGGGGGGTLYSTLGQNTDGALTQKASTDLLVHAKPDGTNDLISNNKITLGYLPDSILGQVVYGGGFVPNTAVATLTTNAQDKLGTTSATITLTNDATAITGYEANEGIYYLATANGTFASISFATGDWLISTGNAWSKVDNTDAVTGVKGNSESTYRLGNVNLTSANIGAIENATGSVATSNIADNAVTTAKILDSNVTTAKINDGAVTMAKLANTNFVLSDNPGTVTPVSPYVNTGDIMDSAVTTVKINDGAVTNAKIGSAAVKATNIDFSTLGFGNYSETEVDTGFTWVNGKTLYKKTIYISSLPNNTTGYYDHNISNMETPVKIEPILMNGAETASWVVPYKILDLVTVNNTRIEVETLYDFSSYHMYVTIYYTKSS